jgi:hypothetical protein
VGLLDDLQQLIDREKTREQQAEQQTALDARLDRLEQSLGDRVAEALSSVLKPKGGDSVPESPRESPPAGDEPEPEPQADPEPELPLERVSRAQVPRIWQGDDEPSTVRYIDADSGEEKTRKGRRKGRPATIDVVEVGPDDEPADEPPAEEATA